MTEEYSTLSSSSKKSVKKSTKAYQFVAVTTESTEYVYTCEKINAHGRNVRDPANYGGIEPGTTAIYYDGDNQRIIIEHRIRKIPIKSLSELKG